MHAMMATETLELKFINETRIFICVLSYCITHWSNTYIEPSKYSIQEIKWAVINETLLISSAGLNG